MPINFADVQTNDGEQGSFEPLPEGRYTVLVEEAKVGVSQQGNDKLSLTFVVLDEGKYKGRKLWHDLSVTPKALVFVKYFLEAIQSPLANSTNAELKDLAIEAKNKKCTVFVEPGVTNNGNPKNNLKNFKPIAGDPLANEQPVSTPKTQESAKKTMFN